MMPRRSHSTLARALAPPPDVTRIFASEEEMRSTYRFWRRRQLVTTFVGYAIFYFVRKNFSMAMPLLESEGYTKKTLGVFLTVQDVVYGLSKFLNGILADRANPRWFMAFGLFASAGVNLLFGLQSAVVTMGVLLILNGWFQGMGFPPVARVLSHWFSPRERGTMWGVWNTSHQVGAAGIFVLGGYLATHLGWRAVFIVPAFIAAAAAVFIAARLRDTPGSLGLPAVEVLHDDPASLPVASEAPASSSFSGVLYERVFSNPYVWLICFANFFIYVIRYACMNWIPTYLSQVKSVSLDRAGWTLAFFEIAGLVGSLLAGWLTDRFFGSRRAPVCVAFMLATGLSVLALWVLPSGASPWAVDAAICAVGFFDYGPQFLVGVMMADIASKEAAATAIGLSGFFGYLSGIVSGWGMATIVDLYGWDGGFKLLVGCAAAGTVLFMLCWNARARSSAPLSAA